MTGKRPCEERLDVLAVRARLPRHGGIAGAGLQALEIAALHAFNEDEEDDADACSAAHPSACDPDGEAPAPGPDDATFSWKDDFGRPDTMIDA